jgi:glycerate kinase
MRIVVAPQEFKGSLTAAQAARAIAAGLRAVLPDAAIVEAPMSDGGAGLVDALLAAHGGQRIESPAHDPLMRPIRAAWALLPDGTAAIEMAAASGVVLLAPHELNPLIATTCGTGDLIRAALERGCTRLVVGVGGSATVDAGAGAMQALGARLLDPGGRDLPPGGASLARLDRIDLSHRDERLTRTKIRIASDVTNPLCGPEGAAAVFAPQKGAAPDDVRILDAALRRFAEVARRDCGVDLLTMPGTGAAGGLGAGLVALAGASIEPGFDLVAEAAGLERQIAGADVVITGEGRLDAQTAYGKTAHGVSKLARAHHKRVAVIAGSVAADYDAAAGAFDLIESVLQPGMALDEAVANAEALLRDAASRVAERIKTGTAGD